jgi:hypothetical protein
MKVRIALIAALATLATVAIAGNVADRTSAITLSRTAGTATWTNTVQYASVEIARLDVIGGYYAADTITVSRVTSDGTYTQTVGSVAFTSGSKGNTATFTAAYLKHGDKLTFSSGTASNSTAIIEYEVQQH